MTCKHNEAAPRDRNGYCDPCWRAALARPFTPEEWAELDRMANEQNRGHGPLFAPGAPRLPSPPKPRKRATAAVLADMRKTFVPESEDHRLLLTSYQGAAAGDGWRMTATNGSAALFERDGNTEPAEGRNITKLRELPECRIDLPLAFDLALSRALAAFKGDPRAVPMIVCSLSRGVLTIATSQPRDGVETSESIAPVTGANLDALTVPWAYDARLIRPTLGQWPIAWYLQQGTKATGCASVLTSDAGTWRAVVMPRRR